MDSERRDGTGVTAGRTDELPEDDDEDPNDRRRASRGRRGEDMDRETVWRS